MHSVALVAVMPSYPVRKQYNLGAVSSAALELGKVVDGAAAAPRSRPADASSSVPATSGVPAEAPGASVAD